MRQRVSVPILEGLKAWLLAHEASPRKAWTAAVGYVLRHWQWLCQYTQNGCVEIDNNLVENAIRPLTLGRKNYLFAGGRQNAVLYTLLGTCLHLKINPWEWLTDVLKRWPTHPPDQIAELLPHRWKPLPQSDD